MCCICRHSSVAIMPELKGNILNFCYGINFKYERMLVHSFYRFHVVTEFILPTMEDLKVSLIHFDEIYEYLHEQNGCNHNSKEYSSDLRVYCKLHYYKN